MARTIMTWHRATPPQGRNIGHIGRQDQVLGFVHYLKGSDDGDAPRPGLPRKPTIDGAPNELLADLLEGIRAIKDKVLEEDVGPTYQSPIILSDTRELFERLGPRLWPDDPSDRPVFVHFNEASQVLKFSDVQDRSRLLQHLTERVAASVIRFRETNTKSSGSFDNGIVDGDYSPDSSRRSLGRKSSKQRTAEACEKPVVRRTYMTAKRRAEAELHRLSSERWPETEVIEHGLPTVQNNSLHPMLTSNLRPTLVISSKRNRIHHITEDAGGFDLSWPSRSPTAPAEHSRISSPLSNLESDLPEPPFSFKRFLNEAPENDELMDPASALDVQDCSGVSGPFSRNINDDTGLDATTHGTPLTADMSNHKKATLELDPAPNCQLTGVLSPNALGFEVPMPKKTNTNEAGSLQDLSLASAELDTRKDTAMDTVTEEPTTAQFSHEVPVETAGNTSKQLANTRSPSLPAPAQAPCDLDTVLKETKLVLIFGDDELLWHLEGLTTINDLVKAVEGLFEEELKGKEIYRLVVDPNDVQQFQSSAQGRSRVILRPGYPALYDRFLEILQSQHVLGHRQFVARVHVRDVVPAGTK